MPDTRFYRFDGLKQQPRVVSERVSGSFQKVVRMTITLKPSSYAYIIMRTTAGFFRFYRHPSLFPTTL